MRKRVGGRLKVVKSETDEQSKSISIIIPTLNEATNLPLLFDRIHKSLTAAKLNYEIIIIDDNSTDNTFNIALTLAKKYNVRVAIKKGNIGKAYSLLEGFEIAKNDIVCMIDADLQYPPEEIVPMYKKLVELGVDIVITERIAMKSSRVRRLSTKVFNLVFAKAMFGLSYDTQSGLKLFRKSVLESIEISPSPWSFDLEFIVRSLEAGHKIYSHKIPFYQRYSGQPKIAIIKVAYELSVASIKLRQATSLSLTKTKYKQNREYIRSASLIMLAVLLIGVSILGSTQQASALAPGQNSHSSSVNQPASATNLKVNAVDYQESSHANFYQSSGLSKHQTNTLYLVAAVMIGSSLLSLTMWRATMIYNRNRIHKRFIRVNHSKHVRYSAREPVRN
jgi:glycosyltransferase involved in cell wall biosynthesis